MAEDTPKTPVAYLFHEVIGELTPRQKKAIRYQEAFRTHYNDLTTYLSGLETTSVLLDVDPALLNQVKAALEGVKVNAQEKYKQRMKDYGC